MIPGAVAFERQRAGLPFRGTTSFEVVGRLPGRFVLIADVGLSSGLTRPLGKNVIGHLRVRPGRSDSPFFEFLPSSEGSLAFLSTQWTPAFERTWQVCRWRLYNVVYG